MRLTPPALVEQMRSVIEDVPDHSFGHRPRLLVEWWPKPVIGAGAKSWVHDLIQAAGGENVLADRDCESTPLTDEEVRAASPDAVVISWCGVPESHYRPEVVYRRQTWSMFRRSKSPSPLYFWRPIWVVQVRALLMVCWPFVKSFTAPGGIMKIVSLLPSATEILCALGLEENQLVAVSHECDFPASVTSLPKATASRIPHGLQPEEIDKQVREAKKAGLPLYVVDGELLSQLEPDLIVTQGLCDVCAVTPETVDAASLSCRLKPWQAPKSWPWGVCLLKGCWPTLKRWVKSAPSLSPRSDCSQICVPGGLLCDKRNPTTDHVYSCWSGQNRPGLAAIGYRNKSRRPVGQTFSVYLGEVSKRVLG